MKDIDNMDSIFKEGYKLYSEFNYIEAFKFFEQSIKKTGEHYLKSFYKGQSLFNQGKLSDSLVFFTETLEKNPDFLEVSKMLATVNFKLGKYDESLRFNNELLEKNPPMDERIKIVHSKVRLIDILKKRKVEINFDDNFEEGIWNYVRRDPNAALKSFEDHLKSYPSDHLAHLYCALIFCKYDKVDTGIEVINKFIELEPNYANGWYIKARLLDKAKDFDAAIECCKKAIELNTNPDTVRYESTLRNLNGKVGVSIFGRQFKESEHTTATKLDESADQVGDSQIQEDIDPNAIVSFRGAELHSYEVKLLKLFEIQARNQFTLVNELEFGTKMGFTVENNLITGISIFSGRIYQVPDSIGDLSGLKKLFLMHNNFTKLPESIKNLSSLEVLFLNKNRLTSFPEDIAELKSLKELSIANNQIKNIPESITALSSLKFLSLNGIGLTKLPEFITELTSLESLDLMYNKFSVLPESIGNLKSLKTLSLEHNELRTLPESLKDLPSLLKIDLQSNGLTSLPEILTELKPLKELSATHNNITHLPDSIGNLPSLEKLILHDNNITSLPESIGNLKSLKILALSNNSLKTLPASIGNLKNLESLGVRENELSALPDSIGMLTSLSDLWLSDNKLESLPENITELPSLKQLEIIGDDNLDIENFAEIYVKLDQKGVDVGITQNLIRIGKNNRAEILEDHPKKLKINQIIDDVKKLIPSKNKQKPLSYLKIAMVLIEKLENKENSKRYIQLVEELKHEIETGQVKKPSKKGRKKPNRGPDISQAMRLYDTAMALVRKNQVRAAISFFKKALEADPSYNEARVNLGVTYNMLNQPQKAIAWFKKAVEQKPTDFYPWFNMGISYYKIKKYNLSNESFDKAIEIDETSFDSWINKGLCFMSLEQYNDAVESFKKAVKLDPRNDNAWINMGSSYFGVKNYQEAANCFEKVLEINPSNMLARKKLKVAKSYLN